VTAFVKNGVELGTSDDWDCDGIADAYDNCVGIANASQEDADSNGIGDGCESGIHVIADSFLTKKSEARGRKSENKKSKDKILKSAETRKLKAKSKSKSSDRHNSKTSKSRLDRTREKSSRKDAKPQRRKR
jgi:hypothetical protein